MIKRLLTFLLSVLIGFFCMPAPSSAQNLVGQPTSGVFGIKAGVISRMNLDTYPFLQSEIGSCAQVYADFPMGREFYITTAFDFYYIEISRSNQIMLETSLGVKRAFPLRRARMVLQPGGSVGFAYLAEMGDLPAMRLLTVKLFFETHFTIDTKKAWVGELAWFYGPKGDNGETTLSFGPGVMLRVGLAFR